VAVGEDRAGRLVVTLLVRHQVAVLEQADAALPEIAEVARAVPGVPALHVRRVEDPLPHRREPGLAAELLHRVHDALVVKGLQRM